MASTPEAAAEFRVKPTEYNELKFEQGCFGSRWPGYNSPLGGAGVAPKSLNSLKPDTYFLITWFSKLHYVSPTLYEKDADIYNMLHWKEALLLIQEIEAYQSIYEEWANPSGFMDHMTAGTVYVETRVVDWAKAWFTKVRNAPKPDPKDFRVVDRTYDLLDLIAKNDLQVDKTIKNGLALACIRADLKNLDNAVKDFRDRQIGGAEGVTAGLETVESTSFQLLNVVPTILFMDPLREAAYKITVLLVRTAARGAGGALAYGTKEGFLNEALGVLKREVPGLISDLLMAPVNRLTKALGWGDVARDAVFLTLQQIVEFTCGLVKTIIDNRGKKPTRDQWERLLVERLSSLVGVLCMRLFRVKLNDKNVKVAISATVEALAKVLTSEIYVIYKTCDEQDRDVAEVVLAELPTIIMRLAEAVLVGFAQRKASQAAEYAQTQRITDQTDLTEATTIAKKTTVSQIWNGKLSRDALMEVRSGRARAIQFTDWEYTQVRWTDGDRSLTWRNTNLEYETAAGVRRFADECQMLCFFHAPNKSRLLHTETPEAKGAKWGKPGTLQTKSADGPDMGELAGLVVKPGNGPPATHKDVSKARSNWEKHLPEALRNGMMVRPDGVVFHPDQLESWGNIKPFDIPRIARAIPVLHKLQKAGIWDLSNAPEPEQRSKLNQLIALDVTTREEVEEVRSLVQSAKIGFYSDLDPIDFVDANNGESKHFGNKPKESLDIAAENRRLINEYVSMDLAGKNIESDPRQSKAPGVGGEPDHRIEHPESEIQHGASMQMEGRGVAVKDQKVKVKDGAFAAGPGAELVFFFAKTPKETLDAMSPDDRETAVHEEIMKQWDEFVKSKVGDKKFVEQDRRVDKIKKDYKPLSHKIKKVKQTPPPITTEQIEESSRMVDGIVVLEEKGLDYEIPFDAVRDSLKLRGLDADSTHILEAAYHADGYPDVSPHALDSAVTEFGTLIGIDKDRSNIVIAVRHYGRPMYEAVASLIRTRYALGNLVYGRSGHNPLQIWYEIYSSYRPVTVGYVRDRIGGLAPGLPGPYEGLAVQCATFAKPKDKRVYAFCIKGVVPAYTPEKMDAKFEGLCLHDVLEDVQKFTLSDRETIIKDGDKDLKIAVFTSPIEDDCKHHLSPEEKKAAIAAAKEKSREKSAAAMAGSAP